MHATSRRLTPGRRWGALAVLVLASALMVAPAAQADTVGPIDFESYAPGDIHGQGDWSKTGSYDVEVANVHGFAAASGYGFGDQALRSSNATTSGSFGDQTFSPGLTVAAGEGAAAPYFTASFKIGTTQSVEQAGLHLSVSPDGGDGSRMSYLRFDDEADGVHVFFVDATDAGPLPAPAAFDETEIATLDHAHAHAIKLSIAFEDGAGNDVVNVFVDGVHRHTGTTWEDYYRFDPEQSANGNQVPTVSKLLFRESGGSASVAGQGFLIDGVSLGSSSAVPCADAFGDDPVTRTSTLTADCTTDHTIEVADGWTLDGDGHTITAVDASGLHFLGAVVAGDGLVANVKDLTVTASSLADVCDGGANRLRGILLDGASGSITGNTVTGVRQGPSGCQEGNAIEARNFDSGGSPGVPQRSVTISGNSISGYQKNGITANGGVSATITGNAVTGDGPIGYIAQNGIQVGFGAGATVKGNTVSGNYYTPSSDLACGLLMFQAGGVKASGNTMFANERDQCNFGKGGGATKPATS
jgi:hypothetical protein